MSLKRSTSCDPIRTTKPHKRRASAAYDTSTGSSVPPRLAKDLTNTVHINAKPSAKDTIAIPFPLEKRAPSPDKPSRSRTSSIAKSERAPTPALPQKRRLLRDALAKRNTAVLSQTLNFETLSLDGFGGSSLTPASILELVESQDVYYHAWVAVKHVMEAESYDSVNKLLKAALDQFIVELGIQCLDRIVGPHLTFIDPRLHEDAIAIVRKARSLLHRFERAGVGKSQVVFSIPATQQGVLAAQQLELAGINTDLALVSGLLHAAACAEAGATTITLSVGPLLDWHEAKRKATSRDLNDHPGIQSIQTILEYFRIHKIKTKLVGSNFRRLTELSPLGRGLDAVSLSEPQIAECQWSRLSLSPPLLDTAEPALRARQAQYPTALLDLRKGFMSAMSAETRSMVTATLYLTLAKMNDDMDTLEGILSLALEQRLEVDSTDMTVLYRQWRAQQRSKANPLLDAGLAQSRKELEQDWFLCSVGRDIHEELVAEELEEEAAAAAVALEHVLPLEVADHLSELQDGFGEEDLEAVRTPQVPPGFPDEDPPLREEE